MLMALEKLDGLSVVGVRLPLSPHWKVNQPGQLDSPAKGYVPSGMCFEYTAFRTMGL